MDYYQIRHLSNTDLKQMHRTFLEAFIDYPVPMHLNYSQFESRMLCKLNINFKYSVGAFSGEKLVGFLFNTLNSFQNVATLYNGGTGVLPGHRGNGLTLKMYDYLGAAGVPSAERFLLETLTSNRYAIEAYEKIGFKKKRYFLCFKLGSKIPASDQRTYDARVGSLASWQKYAELDTLEGCFSDSFGQLRYNHKLEKVLECYIENKMAGYLIFQPDQGRISRIAVTPGFRRKGAGTFLISQAYKQSGKRPLYLINVPAEATGLHQFLINKGFENQINQFEMERVV